MDDGLEGLIVVGKMRGIKPDFWTDENVVELSIGARLLFVGLWTYACDNGHLQDKPKQIKMRVFPGDDVAVAELLDEICGLGLISRGSGWITIPNLTKHQNLDRRYFKSCAREGCAEPETTTSQRESRRAPNESPPSAQRAPDERTAVARAEGEGEGEGEEKVKGKNARAGEPAAEARKRAHQLPPGWQPNEAHRQFAIDANLDLEGEAAQFVDHHRARGTTMKDWDAAFRTWLRNAVKWSRDQPARARPPRVLPEASTLELPPDGLNPEEYAAWVRESRERRERLRA